VISAVVLLVTDPLAGQTLPLPVVPPPLPSALLETASNQPQRWEYTLGLAGGYDSNVMFVPQGLGDVVFTPLGGLVRVFPSPRGQVRIEGSGRGFVYKDQSSLSHADGGVGVNGARSLSPTSKLAADIGAEVTHTSNYSVLDEQGVLLPLSRMLNVRSSIGLDWQIGVHNTMRLGGRAYQTNFEAPQLVDSTSLRASLDFDRRLGERNTLTAHYAFEYSKLDFPYSTQYVSLQWGLVLSRQSALLVEGGISHTTSTAESGLTSTRNFYGGAAFVREMGHSRVVLFARREVLPAFGVGGLRLADRVGLRATVPMGRTWQLDLAGRHVRCPDGCARYENDDSGLSDEATVAIGRSLGHRYIVAGQCRYRRRGVHGTIPATEGFQAALVFSFSNPRANGLWVWTASPLFGPARLTE
jgi:hypothetical protein